MRAAIPWLQPTRKEKQRAMRLFCRSIQSRTRNSWFTYCWTKRKALRLLMVLGTSSMGRWRISVPQMPIGLRDIWMGGFNWMANMFLSVICQMLLQPRGLPGPAWTRKPITRQPLQLPLRARERATPLVFTRMTMSESLGFCGIIRMDTYRSCRQIRLSSGNGTI